MVSIHQILLQQGRQLWQVENAQRVEAEHMDKSADKSSLSTPIFENQRVIPTL